MKSIKEKAEENLQENKDEILCVYDRYAGFVDGANYVFETIEKALDTALDEMSIKKGYLAAREVIEQLKK